MSRMFALTAAVALIPGAGRAAVSNAWDEWHRALQRQCPFNHVEWDGGQGYDELLGAYSMSLPRSQSRRLDRAANYQANCGKVSAGFECEMGAYLKAARRLGMLKDMAAFSCRAVRCQEAGICNRLPNAR
jgi:hypothetical protein